MVKIQVNSQGKAYYTSGGKVLLVAEAEPVIEMLNVTPTTSAQTITAPTGTDGYSPVNVAAVTASIDANILPENIKKNVVILNTTGTYEGSGGSSFIETIFRGEIDSNGKYIPAYMLEYEGDISFNGIKTIDTSSYSTGQRGAFASYLYHEMTSATRLKVRIIKGKISFPDLETVNDNSCFYSFCNGQNKITEFTFDKLEKISGNSLFSYFCQDAAELETVRFTKLSSIIGSSVFFRAFARTTALKDIYFNALKTTSFGNTTDQFANMMNNAGADIVHTIHFPSNLQPTISGLEGYPLFGGTSGYVTLAFDLPATS